jgi:hypothetical protein
LTNYFNINSKEELDRNRFNAFDFGITEELSFEMEPLVVGFNYNIGLAKVAKENESTEEILGDAKNTVIQIYAGILF